MSGATFWLAVIFLPAFPLSAVFNAVFARVRNAALRVLLLLVWPQAGLALVLAVHRPVPEWLLSLALFTSALYAFRAIGLREVGQWIGYLATSGWALLWVALANGTSPQLLHLYALAFSVPLVLLALLGARLERQLGAAYTGLYGGLAQLVPRLAGVLVFVVLAAVAAPLSPAFFAMLAAVIDTTPTAPLAALVVVGIWLLWSWAGVRLLQGLIVGPGDGVEARDLGLASTWAYAAALVVLVVAGFYLAGGAL